MNDLFQETKKRLSDDDDDDDDDERSITGMMMRMMMMTGYATFHKNDGYMLSASIGLFNYTVTLSQSR